MEEKPYSVNFAVSLMWEEKSGALRRVGGRCLNLSPEGMRIETRDRLGTGTAVLVLSPFGRMGYATVRYCRLEAMKCMIGLSFSRAYALEEPARRRILEKVLVPRDADEDAAGAAARTMRTVRMPADATA